MKIDGKKITCKQGNIVEQDDCEAIVNAANAYLRMGGGVAGAIHRAAGPLLDEETAKLAPIKPGEAVITSGHHLPNKYIIHTLGPIFGRDKPSDKILANCYRNCLKRAEENKIPSIAFPAISTGAFGYPIEAATQIAITTVMEELNNCPAIKVVRFILFSKSDLAVYEKALTEIENKN